MAIRGECHAQNVANTAWAFAKMEMRPEALVKVYGLQSPHTRTHASRLRGPASKPRLPRLQRIPSAAQLSRGARPAELHLSRHALPPHLWRVRIVEYKHTVRYTYMNEG